MKVIWRTTSIKKKYSVLIYATILFVCSSCLSSFKKLNVVKIKQPKVDQTWGDLNRSYLEHYVDLFNDFLDINSHYIKRASPKTQQYLNSLWKKSIRNDKESKKSDLIIYYYDDQQPFYLVTPEGKLILSVGLIDKYLRNQSLLSIVLMESILRIKYQLFLRTVFIPTGNFTVRQAINILKIDLKTKTNINKWIYYYLKKSKGDVASLLDWVQVKNRNSLDFSLLNNNGYDPLEEEKLLKKFLLKDKAIEGFQEEVVLSPKTFYQFRAEAIKGSKR